MPHQRKRTDCPGEGLSEKAFVSSLWILKSVSLSHFRDPDVVAGMVIEVLSVAVIAHGGLWISMTGQVLNLPDRCPAIESQGDRRVPQRVGGDPLGDARLPSPPLHHLGNGVR